MVLAASPSTAKEMSHSGRWSREGAGCWFCRAGSVGGFMQLARDQGKTCAFSIALE